MEAKKSHYALEDEPKATVDTALEMYQQSKAVVADSVSRAEQILGEAGPLLESLYNAASAAQNTDLMASVNSAWEKTQELAKIVGQQGAAVNGADVVIDVIKKSREAVLEELNSILKALDDNGSHPKVAAFREDIEEYVREWVYEDALWNDDSDFDMTELVDEMFHNVETLLEDIRFIERREVVNGLADVLFGYAEWDAEQEDLLKKLFKSFEKGEKRAPIEKSEDYEADEADE